MPANFRCTCYCFIVLLFDYVMHLRSWCSRRTTNTLMMMMMMMMMMMFICIVFIFSVLFCILSCIVTHADESRGVRRSSVSVCVCLCVCLSER